MTHFLKDRADVRPCFWQRCSIAASLLVVFVLASGCASSLGSSAVGSNISDMAPGAFPNHPASAVLAYLPTYPAEFAHVRLEAQIAVSSPEMDGRFTAIIESKRNEALFARIRFPMGIEGARVLITRDSAFTFDRIQNEVYRGSSDRVKQLFPGSLMSLDLVEQATGFLSPDPSVSWEIEHDSTRYYLHAPDGSMRYTVDPASWRIEHIQLRDADSTLVQQRWYLDYRTVNGIVVPTRTILVQPTLDTRLSISLRSLEKNPETAHFDLGLRADTKWKDISP